MPSHRTYPGKFIDVEGIDGSGKQTQVTLLTRALESRGYSVLATAFPQYQSWFGKMVGQFLNGELGPLESVDPHFAALLYAGDRFECKRPMVEALQAGRVVLTDRYVASSLAHQTARAAPGKQAEFRAWIEHLEFGIFELPREDLVIYLRVPPHVSQKLVTKKSARTYTECAHDLLEADLRHLQDAADNYDALALDRHWKTIECYDAGNETMRTPKEISAEVLAAVLPCLATMKENR
jgi:dTMP kinase